MRDILNDLEAGRHLSDADPVKRAQIQMRQPLPKRFYTRVSVGPEEGSFVVRLDGRPVRSPGRSLLRLPTEAAAQLVADEFGAQGETIDPVSMPATRLVNTVIDGVAADTQAVLEDILRFSASDLICYRAGDPERLVELQCAAWDPIVDWVRSRLGSRLVLAEGVMHVEQPRETIAAIGMHLKAREEPFRLACLHVITTLTGSALIALALENGEIDADTAWAAAHVDEDWNLSLWGEDAEAAARRRARRRDMDAAVALLCAID